MFGKRAQAVLSPAMIMSIVVSLIILAVGVYAFFTTTDMVAPVDKSCSTTTGYNKTWDAIHNATIVGNQLYNVIGVVLVIGAILLIVSMVYSYTRP